MPSVVSNRISVKTIVIVVFVLAGAVIAAFLLRSPGRKTSESASASPEARAYVKNLSLSDVKMQATENFMNQRVVEIEGQIANNGSRALSSVEIYCIFAGVDGHEIYREIVPIVQAKGASMKPHEVRPFRLPFDTLPNGWNQAMPSMAIASIAFAE